MPGPRRWGRPRLCRSRAARAGQEAEAMRAALLEGTRLILPGPFDRPIRRSLLFWVTWRNEQPENRTRRARFRVLR